VTIFTDQAAAIQELKTDYLSTAAETYLGGKIPSDNGLWRKLQAAEAEARRKLGVPLEPTMIFAFEPSQAEIDALAGKPYMVEPGYDMEPTFFGSQSWGALMLRQRPVIAIESMRFVYPSMLTTMFEVPSTWITVDKKYGQVQIVPGPGVTNAPVSVFTLQAVGSGTRIPHMIHVRYRAGLDCTQPENFDVVDIIMQMAVLRTINDAFAPQSGSISADGLSQSVSVDMSKLQEGIDDRLADLKQKICGPVWGVL
jgi:hypothetical protein